MEKPNIKKLEGIDLYALLASKLYDVPYEQCLKSYGPDGARRRKNAKEIVLYSMYGGGNLCITHI